MRRRGRFQWLIVSVHVHLFMKPDSESTLHLNYSPTQAVEGLIRSQKVSYGFEFFELEQEADAPVTVLSCGRSMLKDAIALWLPLEASSPEPTAGVLADVAGQLPLFRAFLAHARGLDFSIPSSMTETIEKGMVEPFTPRVGSCSAAALLGMRMGYQTAPRCAPADLAAARQKDSTLTAEALHSRLNVG